jgi:hypothetical protein
LKGELPDAAKILLRNVYGWFVRVDRGLYALSPSPAGLRWCAGKIACELDGRARTHLGAVSLYVGCLAALPLAFRFARHPNASTKAADGELAVTADHVEHHFGGSPAFESHWRDLECFGTNQEQKKIAERRNAQARLVVVVANETGFCPRFLFR